ncbi:MAG: 30S ribosomal protein S16 [Gemmatimonas sp.]|nr:30S ribosomal protein S16 [Gemmatimonas sp.]
MSTTIRLTRMGRKQRPFYRLIVTDSRNRRDGAYLANLGYYNPFAEPLEVKLHEQEIIAWLRKGATVSETARSLMRREGVLLRWELLRQGLSVDEVETRVSAWKSDLDGRLGAKVQAKAEQERKAKAEAVAAKKAADEAAAAAEAAAAKQAAAEAAAAAEAEAAAVETPAEGDATAQSDAPAEES